MNKVTLFVGALALMCIGIVSEEKSMVSAGLVLMWMGLAMPRSR